MCNIYQKPKNSVVWEGRPNFSFLFKSCEILEVKGDLSINVEDKKSLRVDRQACKNYALALVLCAFNNSKSNIFTRESSRFSRYQTNVVTLFSDDLTVDS